jgi:hypothetical protein
MKRGLPNLRQALNAAMAAVVGGGAPLALGGCGGKDVVGPGIENDPGFVPVDCSPGSQRWLSGLTPAVPTEYMELRLIHGGQQETSERIGVLCGGARDAPACEASFGRLSGEGFTFGYVVQVMHAAQIAATQGDDALLIAHQGRVVPFLAPIDTPQDAMFVVQSAMREIHCSAGGSKPSGDGFDVQAFSYPGCGGKTRHVVHVDADGNMRDVSSVVLEEPTPNCQVGRRPAGLYAATHRASGHTAGGWFARCATLEAASVYAFQRLRRELRKHGAPRSLLDAARRAERDEVRHARVVAGLARAFGVETPPARVEKLPIRDLASIALENVVEGCVRETYGALAAKWQARHAVSSRVRRAYARIAGDELRHAELGWRVAAWAEARLSRGARARVRAARREAVSELLTEVAAEPSAELVEHAGVPRAAQASALVKELARSVWA